MPRNDDDVLHLTDSEDTPPKTRQDFKEDEEMMKDIIKECKERVLTNQTFVPPREEKPSKKTRKKTV